MSVQDEDEKPEDLLYVPDSDKNNAESRKDPFLANKKPQEFKYTDDWTLVWALVLFDKVTKEDELIKMCPICGKEPEELEDYPWLCGTCLTMAWRFMKKLTYKVLASFLHHWPRRMDFQVYKFDENSII